ncbi:MAG: DUF5063 domain-containing protein [Bacteroidales bacterium]|nr:DUF5063 domain-containing protein [Bacteroidales bacterium]
MNTDSPIVNTNSLAFIALCNEYCAALENAREMERTEFIEKMVRILPRIYISANDLQVNMIETEEPYIDGTLDEDYYEAVRRNVERLIGPDDVYLEVFEEDMKYSDTPVSASISESLADLFQVMFNFIAMVQDATDEIMGIGLLAMREDFKSYWGQILCNVMRALHKIAFQEEE